MRVAVVKLTREANLPKAMTSELNVCISHPLTGSNLTARMPRVVTNECFRQYPCGSHPSHQFSTNVATFLHIPQGLKRSLAAMLDGPLRAEAV